MFALLLFSYLISLTSEAGLPAIPQRSPGISCMITLTFSRGESKVWATTSVTFSKRFNNFCSSLPCINEICTNGILIHLSFYQSRMVKLTSPKSSKEADTWSPGFNMTAPVTPPVKITSPAFSFSPLFASMFAKKATELAG